MPSISTAALPMGVAGYPTERVMVSPPSPAYVPAATDVGAFRDGCSFSHMSYDDPIVYPGQPGKSHLHVFFGNTDTNANSTAASIAGSGGSTCGGGTANRTGYWIPAMIDTKDGTPIVPAGIQVYYKTGYSGVHNEDVKPFPAGLRMISGDPTATTETPWGPNRFACAPNDVGSPAAIPDCDAGPDSNLQMGVGFPQCWDGVNLDSPDHKSHMAYANGQYVFLAPGEEQQGWMIPVTKTRGCPDSHPVALTGITYKIYYPVTEPHATSRWRLSSDNYDSKTAGGYSSHGDWFNGWDQQIMETWVTHCLNKSLDCHDFVLGDGRTLY